MKIHRDNFSQIMDSDITKNIFIPDNFLILYKNALHNTGEIHLYSLEKQTKYIGNHLNERRPIMGLEGTLSTFGDDMFFGDFSIRQLISYNLAKINNHENSYVHNAIKCGNASHVSDTLEIIGEHMPHVHLNIRLGDNVSEDTIRKLDHMMTDMGITHYVYDSKYAGTINTVHKVDPKAGTSHHLVAKIGPLPISLPLSENIHSEPDIYTVPYHLSIGKSKHKTIYTAIFNPASLKKASSDKNAIGAHVSELIIS